MLQWCFSGKVGQLQLPDRLLSGTQPFSYWHTSRQDKLCVAIVITIGNKSERIIGSPDHIHSALVHYRSALSNQINILWCHP